VGDDRTLKEYLRNLEDAGLIMAVHRAGGRMRSMEKPDKLYLGDPNQCYALAASGNPDAGSVRETFFCRMLLTAHRVQSSGKGDFLVDERRTFEVGGKSKGFGQIAGLPSAWLAVDGIPAGAGTRVPLWLFGFLY
jgi:predicted AAA+ superfamily ATPase